MLDLAAPERLRNRERAVPELRLRCDQLDAETAVPQCLERERRLERGDAASCDQNVGWMRVHGRLLSRGVRRQAVGHRGRFV